MKSAPPTRKKTGPDKGRTPTRPHRRLASRWAASLGKRSKCLCNASVSEKYAVKSQNMSKTYYPGKRPQNGVSKGLRSRGVDAEGRSRRSGLQREVMVAMMVVMKVVIVVMVVMMVVAFVCCLLLLLFVCWWCWCWCWCW